MMDRKKKIVKVNRYWLERLQRKGGRKKMAWSLRLLKSYKSSSRKKNKTKKKQNINRIKSKF